MFLKAIRRCEINTFNKRFICNIIIRCIFPINSSHKFMGTAFVMSLQMLREWQFMWLFVRSTGWSICFLKPRNFEKLNVQCEVEMTEKTFVTNNSVWCKIKIREYRPIIQIYAVLWMIGNDCQVTYTESHATKVWGSFLSLNIMSFNRG